MFPIRKDSDKAPQLHKVSGGLNLFYVSLVVRKPAFCIFENKDADQLRGDREADQRLCFSLY